MDVVKPSETYSDRFCAPDHDITLRSSDNVLFQVHVVNLQMHSDGFAAGAGCSGTDRGPSPPETVPLTETAATLDLLLQYMYLQPQPDLSTVSFEELAGLAEAAEKYQVYAAIPICKVHMEYAMREHPFNVIAYAARHSYIDMANKAALLTFGAPLLDAVDNLPPQYMRAWALYQHAFEIQVAQGALRQHPFAHYYADPGVHVGCSQWARVHAVVVARLREQRLSLETLAHIFAFPDEDELEFDTGHLEEKAIASLVCKNCAEGLIEWRKRVERHIHDIPLFSSFL